MTLKGLLVGFIAAFVVLALGAGFAVKLGLVPVATSAPPLPFETFLAHTALNARVAKEAPQTNPMPLTEPNYIAGAELYRQHCAVCHGLPGQPQTAIAKGMFPKPPQLFEGKGVSDDPAGETYWKIRNGIRLTGMPGFQNSLNDDQMWRIASVLANSDKLPAAVQEDLKAAQ